jgi:DNA polymerase-4
MKIPETMVKTKPVVHSKFRWLVTSLFNYCRALAFEPFRHIRNARRMLQQMIGKNGIDIWKKANGIDNNPVALHGKKVDLNGTHLWTRHYRHSKLKSM